MNINILKEIGNDYLKKVKDSKLGVFNSIFLGSLIILYLYPDGCGIDIRIGTFDITSIARNAQVKIFNQYSIIRIRLLVILAMSSVILAIIAWILYEFNKELENEIIDDRKRVVSFLIAIKRIWTLAFYYYHNLWITLFFIQVLGVNEDTLKSLIENNSIFQFNSICLFGGILMTLFCVELPIDVYGKDFEYSEYRYICLTSFIKQNNEYLFLKDKFKEPSIYLLVEHVDFSNVRNPFKYKVLNYSKKFDEIKYQFLELKQKAQYRKQ